MDINIGQELVLDDFRRTGTDPFRLADIIGQVEKGTRAYRLNGSDITWWVLTSNGTNEVIRSCPADHVKSGFGRDINLETLRRKGCPVHDWSDELWNEATVRSRVFCSFLDETGEQHFLAVTEHIGAEFVNFGIQGPVVQLPSYNLYCLVSERMEDKPVTLITRYVHGKSVDVEKLITIRSESYAYIPQDDALALASSICEDGDIEFWEVNNLLTEVIYTFPQKAVKTTYSGKTADFVPYIRYYTSDAGDGSLTFELGWNVNSTRKIFLASGAQKAARMHKGDWNHAAREHLRHKALKLKEKFTIVSEKMDELNKITVLNQNLERCVRNLCSDAKITTKRTVNALVDHVNNEFIGMDVSAAAIVISMIEAQDTEPVLVDLSDAQKNKLNHLMGELIYQRVRQN